METRIKTPEKDMRLLKDRSFIMVPFFYKEQKPFAEFMKENFEGFQKDVIYKEPLLNHVSGLYEQVQYYVEKVNFEEVQEDDVALIKREIYLFPSKVGFYVSELEFGDKSEATMQLEDKKKISNYARMVTALKDLVEYIEVKDEKFESEWKDDPRFWQIGEKTREAMAVFKEEQPSCILFHALAEELEDRDAYDFRHINKLGTLSKEAIPRGNEEVEAKLEIDKVHSCQLSVKCMAMTISLSKENARKREDIYFYQKNYIHNSFLLFLLLHHERQVLIKCKKDTVELKATSYSWWEKALYSLQKKPVNSVGSIKSNILDCLSLYGFETVSDDAITQLIYAKYRKVLKIPQMEEAMSNLVFKLGDEIGKEKDEKINTLTFWITVLGITSAVSAVMDIISRVMTYMTPPGQ